MIEEQTLVIADLVEQYIERYIAPLLGDPARAEREGQVFGWAQAPPNEAPSGARDEGSPPSPPV